MFTKMQKIDTVDTVMQWLQSGQQSWQQYWLPSLTTNLDYQPWQPILTTNLDNQSWQPILSTNVDYKCWLSMLTMYQCQLPMLTTNVDYQCWQPMLTTFDTDEAACGNIWQRSTNSKKHEWLIHEMLAHLKNGSRQIGPLANLAANLAHPFLGPTLPFLANWAPANWTPGKCWCGKFGPCIVSIKGPTLPGPKLPHPHFPGAWFAGAQYAGTQFA